MLGKIRNRKEQVDERDVKGDEESSSSKKIEKKSSKKEKHRSAIARTSEIKNSSEKLILDSVATAHMTSHADKVKVTSNCNVSISLGNNSKIHSTK